MKKINNRGFSAVEILLIVVVVGVLGFAGWWVWNRNDNQQQQVGSPTNEQNKTDSVSDEWVDKPLVFNSSGDIVGQNEQETIQRLTFVAPAGWQRKEESKNEWIEFLSPDFKGVQFANGSSVTQGGRFSISANKTDYKSIRDMAKEEAIS